jgi:hypothetical protein
LKANVRWNVGRPNDAASREIRGSDASDLDVRTTGNPIDHHGDARRLLAILEEFVVDLVCRLVILPVVQEYVAQDDVAKVEAGFLQSRLNVAHALSDLLFEGGRMAAIGILVPLAGDIQRVAGQDARAVWPVRRRLPDRFALREVGVGDAGDFQAGLTRDLSHA